MIFILWHEGTLNMTCKTSGCIDKDVLSSCHERGTKEKKFRVPNEESNLRPSDSGEEAGRKN